jgi:hypothetical protein
MMRRGKASDGIYAADWAAVGELVSSVQAAKPKRFDRSVLRVNAQIRTGAILKVRVGIYIHQLLTECLRFTVPGASTKDGLDELAGELFVPYAALVARDEQSLRGVLWEAAGLVPDAERADPDAAFIAVIAVLGLLLQRAGVGIDKFRSDVARFVERESELMTELGIA